MHFTKLFALSAMTTLAAATAVVKRTDGGSGGGEGNCPKVQCCKSITKADDPTLTPILTKLGIAITDVNVLVGLNCSPITVIGGGNGACSDRTVYCEDNSHDNLIAIGCITVII
ncbi:hypothetical protein AAF712_002204 [Marasmius tenuissimus]|uniref:Hydrophobin n=1 Tax=Marasmius tenuissimus TaxID=585030 RepID=A0ABR3ADA9_9AGAR